MVEHMETDDMERPHAMEATFLDDINLVDDQVLTQVEEPVVTQLGDIVVEATAIKDPIPDAVALTEGKGMDAATAPDVTVEEGE